MQKGWCGLKKVLLSDSPEAGWQKLLRFLLVPPNVYPISRPRAAFPPGQLSRGHMWEGPDAKAAGVSPSLSWRCCLGLNQGPDALPLSYSSSSKSG